MIPEFPKFKKVEPGDRAIVEAHLQHNRPYSSFNFTNFWAWDIRNERMISCLNGNLVLYFTDYATTEPFLSFHGNKKPVNTVRELFRYADVNEITPVLRFVTEESVDKLKTSKFIIEEDRSNFDYVFSTKKIALSLGKSFKSKRMLSKHFSRTYPNAVYKVIKKENTTISEQIVSVVKRWEQNKIKFNKPCDLTLEQAALERLLKSAKNHPLTISAVYIDEVMIGFSIDEILPRKFAMAHFVKADNTYKGIYEFLNEKTAQYLLDSGVEYWNWQQDLDIPGLKKLKESYRPIDLLKKYRVAPRLYAMKQQTAQQESFLESCVTCEVVA